MNNKSKDIVIQKLESGEFFTRQRTGKSDVWNTFVEVVDVNHCYQNYVMCVTCRNIFACFPRSGTTSLSRHANVCSFKQAQASLDSTGRGNIAKSISVYEKKDVVRRKLETGEYTTRQRTGKSEIWENFVEVVDTENFFQNYVSCKKCKKLFRFTIYRTGTTSLVRHSSACNYAHSRTPVTFASNFSTIKCDSDSKENVRRTVVSVGTTSSCSTGRVKSITYDDKQKLLKACASICIEDFMPFSIFESKAMMAYFQALVDIGAKCGSIDVKTILPSATLLNETIESSANTELLLQMTEIQNCFKIDQQVAFTADLWTESISQKSFFSVVCHFVSHEWKLKHVTLCCRQFVSDEAANINIERELINFLLELGFQNEDLLSKCSFVLNTQSPVPSDLCHYNWFNLSSNILNNLLIHTFKDDNVDHHEDNIYVYFDNEVVLSIGINKVLTECNNLVSHFKRIGEIESILNLRQEYDTCWNSKLALIMTISVEEDNIKRTLERRNELAMFSGIDFKYLNILKEFLESFKCISDCLEDNKYPNFHYILLFKLKLEKHLQIHDHDISMIQELKIKALNILKSEFALKPIYNIGTFLCPKFKSLKFLSKKEQKETYDLAKLLLNNIKDSSKFESEPEQCYSNNSPKRPCFAMDFDEYQDKEKEKDNKVNEVDRYLSASFQREIKEMESTEKVVNDLTGGLNLLHFWKEKAAQFPKLAILAKSLLCIPSTNIMSYKIYLDIVKAQNEKISNPDCLNSTLLLNHIRKM